MSNPRYRRGQRALFTGDGLTEVPCKIVEPVSGDSITGYLIKLEGDSYPRRCEVHQLQFLYTKEGTNGRS